jgi:hypothetical protein
LLIQAQYEYGFKIGTKIRILLELTGYVRGLLFIYR